jgi:hypothetical protein
MKDAGVAGRCAPMTISPIISSLARYRLNFVPRRMVGALTTSPHTA